MKKIISFVMSVILSAVVVGTLGSMQAVDEKLESAEEIAERIFSVAKEEEKVEQGYLSARYLQGVDGTEDFILVQGSNTGYAIFERDSLDIIEYSHSNFSPFQECLYTESYYAGPTNYYREENENLIGIYSKEKIKKEERGEISKKIKEKLKYDKEQRKEDGKRKENKGIKNQSVAFSADKFLENAYMSTYEGNLEADIKTNVNTYTVEKRRYIPHYKYFTSNPEHGDNDGASCGIVAAQLLLSYNNWANDARIIAQPEYLIERTGLENDPYAKSLIGTSSDVKDDGITTFYERLLEDIYYHEEYGATVGDVYYGIRNYLNNVDNGVPSEAKTKISVGMHIFDSVTKEKIEEEVEKGRPTIVGIDYYKPKEGEDGYESVGHFVVVYGYQTFIINDECVEGYIAHFGWSSAYNNAWFRKSWVESCVTFQTTHVHNNITTINAGKHMYKCGVCGGAFLEVTHDKSAYRMLASDATLYRYNHTVVCSCGYEYQKPHEYTFSVIDEDWHLKSCVCGYQMREIHYFKYDECYDCRYLPQ